MRTLLPLLLVFSAVQVAAEVPADPRKDALIASVLEDFWDDARDSKGDTLRPSSDGERHTVPIDTSVAYRVIEAGMIAGEASSCHLPSKDHYRAIIADARQLGMTETQIAFIGALYGARWVQVQTQRRAVCSESERQRVANRLFRSKRLGLGQPEA
jgi:hypothetical protein